MRYVSELEMLDSEMEFNENDNSPMSLEQLIKLNENDSFSEEDEIYFIGNSFSSGV